MPEPDGGTGSAEEPDVLRVSGMHAFLTPPSTPFSPRLVPLKNGVGVLEAFFHFFPWLVPRSKNILLFY